LTHLFKDIFGQTAICEKFSMAIQAKKLHHGYIFSGQKGIGKEAVAIELMKIRNCENSNGGYCGKCKACRDLSALSSEDLLYIQPSVKESENSADMPDYIGHELAKKGAKKGYYKLNYPTTGNISIDQIKEIREFARFASLRKSAKFVIIYPADGMNKEAQNALLKVLEEPPANFHFFLITEHRNQLLPTILSRCQTVDFPDLRTEDLALYLKSEYPVLPPNAELAINNANGSIDNLQKLISADGARLLETEQKLYTIFNKTTPPDTIKQLDELLSLTGNGEVTAAQVLESVSRRIIKEIHQSNSPQALNCVKRLTTYFSSALYMLERNINQRLLFVNIYITYREELRKWKITI